MGDHHPDAAEVIERLFFLGLDETALENTYVVLDAFRAAGLAVVKVGEPPPWMKAAGPWVWSEIEQAVCYRTWGHGDDQPLYVVKEQSSEG